MNAASAVLTALRKDGFRTTHSASLSSFDANPGPAAWRDRNCSIRDFANDEIQLPTCCEIIGRWGTWTGRDMHESMDTNVTPRIGAKASAREIELPAAELITLIERIAIGQQAALNELYDLTVAKLFGLARLILRNSADAEEVVCDTYAQIWESARRFEAGRGSVLGWMLTICRSRALDLLRQRRSRARTAEGFERESQVNEEGDHAGPEVLLQALQRGSSVQRAMAALPPVRRELVALAFLQGLSHQEIVERTGLPLGTVKSHIRRALTVLREELKIWDEHEAVC
jgi:RNA polymerase sigma-70 factor, ECF subfamily